MATTDVSAPALDNKKDTAPPRKRRRRAAASGAAEDCFTCRKRSVQCDRKRPYCSQCIEVGRECGGYRTTLTWGVGVASRGKLRGLSCPVAGKQMASTSPDTKPEGQAHRRKASTSSMTSSADSNMSSSVGSMGQSTFNFSASLPTVQESQPIKIENSQRGHIPPPLRLDIPPMVQPWSQQHYQAPQMMHGTSYPTSPMHLGLPPQVPQSFISPSHESAFPGSAHSVGTFSDAGFVTPHDYPQTPSSYAFSDHLHQYPYSATDSIPPSYDSALLGAHIPPSYPGGSPAYNSASPQSHGSGSDHALADDAAPGSQTPQPSVLPDPFATEGPQPAALPVHDDVFQQFEMTLDDMMTVNDHTEDSNGNDLSLTLTRPIFTNQFFHLSSRMQSLLDFYDKHICSVLVAFDGDANPYRTHILNLASHNEGLQNAIAALATNNIRMRSQKHLQAPGFVQELEDSGPDALIDPIMAVSQPSAEESCYKALSIEQLNMQLAHPSSADDDSVLATLLILCLFHVCDSGFSKFKTQLAGVQKLLALRNKTDTQSGFLGWVQMFFTWFDVMSSTVNDRETEIENDSLDMLDFSTDLGALEQFSGCDGRLFKLIARLGRLNLLSQDRPVRNRTTAPASSGTSSSPFDNTTPFQNQWRRPAHTNTSHQLDPTDPYRLDGNGWSTPMQDYDAEPNYSSPQFPDARTEFWTEWYDVRSRLQSWSMDYSHIPGPSTPSTPMSATTPSIQTTSSLGPEQRDLVHINESFRTSALLYTERLANPHLPSSAPAFQQLVAQGLFHITALRIDSCVNKFLLWPLFIIGTECVDPVHKRTVRTRCVEIQRESGFFNNLSVLEVLERAWREGKGTGKVPLAPVDDIKVESEDSSSQHSTKRTGFHTGATDCGREVELMGRFKQAFKWRKAMDRVDGEYIVV